MNKLRILKLLLISLAFTICISCKQKEFPKGENLVSIEMRIDSAANKFMSESNQVGASIAIASGNKTLYNKGFGFLDLDKTLPITNAHLFNMASISKLIGSVVIMKYVEEGKLNLDQNLMELLPEFPNPKIGRKVKLRHMLSHTSGLPEYSKVADTIYVKTGNPPTKEFIYQFFNDKDLLFEPGTDYDYCNSGFLLMGYIVERISGNTLQSEFDRIVNKPGELDLRLTAEAVKEPLMAPYYEIKNEEALPYEPWTWIKGDGGLTATAMNLAHFPFKWSDGTLISKKSFEDMTEPTMLKDGVITGYGMGVRNGEIAGHKIIGHTGGHYSPLAIMAFFPKLDISFVVFVNTVRTSDHVRKLFAAVVYAYFDLPEPDYRKEHLSLIAPKKLTGSFSTVEQDSISIEYNSDKDELLYCISKNECERMYRIAENRFWSKRWPYDFVEFSFDAEGKVNALKEYYYGYYVLVRKKVTNNVIIKEH